MHITVTHLLLPTDVTDPEKFQLGPFMTDWLFPFVYLLHLPFDLFGIRTLPNIYTGLNALGEHEAVTHYSR